MPPHDTKTSFNRVHKVFHWVMAIIIVMMLAVGYRMVAIEPSPIKFTIYGFHKSFGILILLLVAARLAWVWFNPRPPKVESIKPWEDKLSRLVHFLLYAVMIGMPLSGWLMSSAADFPVPFFYLFNMPDLVPKNETIFGATKEMHEIGAVVLLVLLFLHFSGAFKHHFIDGDDTLRRMTTAKLGCRGAIVLAVLAAAALALPLGIMLSEEDEEENEAPAAAAQPIDESASAPHSVPHNAPAWNIVQAQSKIEFTATQSGAAFTGSFNRFGAKIFFDPDNLAGSYVDVGIGLTGTIDGKPSITTGSAERDSQILGADWFDAANHPLSSFVAERFSAGPSSKPPQFIAHGILTIRGVAKPVDSPFTVDIQESGNQKTADMHAALTLNRLDFGLGQDQWQSTDTIGADVKIDIHVKAKAVDI